jgi:Aldo/keto reductase family
MNYDPIHPWLFPLRPNTMMMMAPRFLFRYSYRYMRYGRLTFRKVVSVALLALLCCCRDDSSTWFAHGLQFGQLQSSSPPAQQRRIGRVAAGDRGLTISELGVGTWQWGNKLLWSYETSQDDEIYEAYKVVRDAGVTVFDTADSYGTLALNGTYVPRMARSLRVLYFMHASSSERISQLVCCFGR